jgi:hypothetical protein
MIGPEQNENEEDILAWCRNLVRTIKDGGVWGLPAAQSAFKIDKQRKCLVLIEPVIPTRTSEPAFLATKKWFKKIGWRTLRNAEYQREIAQNNNDAE